MNEIPLIDNFYLRVAIETSCEPLTAKSILKAINDLNDKINGLECEHIKIFKKETE